MYYLNNIKFSENEAIDLHKTLQKCLLKYHGKYIKDLTNYNYDIFDPRTSVVFVSLGDDFGCIEAMTSNFSKLLNFDH